MKQHKEFWWGLGAFLLFIMIFFVLGTIGWPGDPDPCTHADPGSGRPDICFCERYDLTHPRLVQQPANTWSNLGYVVVGLLILWQVGTDRARAINARNSMEGASLYAIGYGALVLFLGPASMLFHATLRNWGGWGDVMSLILYGGFLLLYDLVRCLRWNTIVFGTIYLALTVVLAILHTISGGGAIGIVLFSILVIAFLVLDIAAILWLKVGGVRRNWLFSPQRRVSLTVKPNTSPKIQKTPKRNNSLARSIYLM